MSKLTPSQRAKLPAKDFGLPEKARSSKAKKESGNYPVPYRATRSAPSGFLASSARKAS